MAILIVPAVGLTFKCPEEAPEVAPEVHLSATLAFFFPALGHLLDAVELLEESTSNKRRRKQAMDPAFDEFVAPYKRQLKGPKGP
jgi:hypothetical protein